MCQLIRVWSILSEVAWQRLQSTGRLSVDQQYIHSDYLPAYTWMADQLKCVAGMPPDGVQYPLWVWVQYISTKRPAPDLRYSAHCRRGVKCVRIEALIPSKRLLLSDFDLWSYVLNDQYLPSCSDDEAAFDARLFGAESLAALEEETRQSWRRVFDLDWDDPLFTSPREEKRIQGVLWDISMSDVVRATPFIAR